MPSRCPRDLEIHVAVVILSARDVERTAYRSPSFTIRPIAMPATGALIGTPASIMARVPPQTDAIEEDPFDSRMSDTMRTVYGQLVFVRNDGHEGAFGERAVADLAAARARAGTPLHRPRTAGSCSAA